MIKKARQNQNGLAEKRDGAGFHYPYKKTNPGAGLDVSLSLLELLSVASCSKAGPHSAVGIQSLGKTDQDRREIQGLVCLLQSLGRPAGGFWRETRVFVNRVVLSDSHLQEA